METQKAREDLLKIDNVLIPIIGIHKYNELKSFSSDKLTEDQKSQIAAYESKNVEATEEQIAFRAKWVQIVHRSKSKPKFSITARKLYNLFKANFQKICERPFIKIEGVTIKKLRTLDLLFFKR